MIDTIKLAIPLKRSLKGADIKWQTTGQISYGYKACIYQTHQDKLAGRYMPAVSYIERPLPGAGMRYELNIEASLPKLIYGDNLHEVNKNDYAVILNRLRYKLLWLNIPEECLRNLAHAEVRKVDFCKNIEFTDGTLALCVIESIGSADVTRIYDVQRTDHKNGGRTYHIHTNCEDVAWYDKVFDMQQAVKSLKRSEENNKFGIATSLEEAMRKRENGPYEVIRLEVRLSSKSKIKQMLNKVDEAQDLTFEHVYCSGIAKKILLLHIDNIFGEIDFAAPIADTPSNILADVLAKNQAHGPKAVFAEVGFRLVANDMKNNTRKLREIITTRLGKDAWRRLGEYRKYLPRPQAEALRHIKAEVENM